MPEKKPINPGLLGRFAVAARYMKTGEIPDAWYSPLEPLQPILDPKQQSYVEGRQWDFPAGYNLRVSPRDGEAVSFAQLRGLADGCDILRSVIETRKDQLEKLNWQFLLKDKKKRKNDDPRIQELNTFFQFPDKENHWNTWLRMLIEDMLVIDAPTIYPRMTHGGKLYSLDVMDGSMITRKIDVWGRTPIPPEPAYQQVIHGLPAVDYTRDELLYLPRNKRSFKAYGYSPVEQVIVTVSTAIRKAIYQMQYYTEGSTPDLILAVPADWQTDQIKEFKTYWDNLMQGNTANRRGTMFVANGTKVIDTKENALKDDFDEWIARVICFVFSIPPTPFIKQMNRATAQTAQESAQEEGLEPLKQWVVNVVNMIVVRFFGYNDIEFAWQEEQVVDPAQQAEVNDVYLKNGTLSVDEVREELGLDPIGMGNAVYTTQGYVLLKDILNPQPDPASIPSGDNLEIDSTDPAQKLLKTSPSDDSLGTNAAETALSGETYSVLRRAARKISRKSAKKLKELGYTEEKMSEAEAESLSADVVKALDLSVLDDLAEPYADELTIVATGQAEKALTSLGVSTDLPFPEAEDYARNRGAELVGKKWVDGELVNNPDAQWVITDTTRDMLKTEIQDAITNGLTMDELTAQLTDSHAFSEVRAAMIARTEVARATSMGSLAGYAVAESQGVKVKKKWVTAGDDKVDTSMCAPNAEAGAIALKSDFPSGDLTPPAHPNCRCSIVPVIDKE